MPVRENTESRKRASSVYHAKRKAEGWVSAKVWLHPFTVKRLADIAAITGSRDSALEACVLAYELPEDED